VGATLRRPVSGTRYAWPDNTATTWPSLVPRAQKPLARHLLVTVSEDTAHQHGLRFVGNFLHHRETSGHPVLRGPPAAPCLRQVRIPGRGARGPHRRSGEERGRRAWTPSGRRGRRALAALGLPREQIRTRFKFREYSTAKDILSEAHHGLYDAVVLGHRGTSSLEQFWSPSVGRTLLDSQAALPCGSAAGRTTPSKRAALRGRLGPSLCMVDHVGFVLPGRRNIW
jgi:hypothetical protein